MTYQADDDEYTIPEPLDASIAFKGIHVAAFANMESPGWIISDILPKAELAVVYGAPGSGKSFMALDMAFSIAMGKEWANQSTIKQSVLYICAEGAGGFKKRLLAYSLHHNIDLNEINNFKIIPEAPNFLLDIDAQSILKYAQIPLGVIIIDTFSRTMPGGDENSAKDMGFAISQCKLLHHATGALIILIHHSGKDADRGSRGWSGLKGAADTEIEVTRIGKARKARITKQKDGDDSYEWGFKLDGITLGIDQITGKDITTCVYVPTNEIPLNPSKPKELGMNEKIILEAFRYFGTQFVPTEDILSQAVKDMVYDKSKDDRRRDMALQALRTLLKKDILASSENKIYKP